MIAMIVENLGARTARTGIAHLPEVVRGKSRAFIVANTDNALCRHTNLLLPDVESFVIGFIDGHPQPFFRQVKPVFTGQQFPGEADSVMFEIVAETEVAQHFEEGMVTCGITDVLQIVMLTACTYATL
ncbi:hypothetical protein D3C71_1439800 [compost metagenome]